MSNIDIDIDIEPRSSHATPGIAFLIGIPAALAVLLLFHPTGNGELVYPIVSDQLGRWQAVHLAMAAFIPLMAWVTYRLTDGIDNPPARLSRAILPAGAVLYGAFEALVGIGTGALVGHVDDLQGADQAIGAQVVEDYVRSPIFRVFEHGGSMLLGFGIIAAAFGLRRAKAIGAGASAALVVAAPLITMHVPPFGPIGLALFVLAVPRRPVA